jgi:putative flippase GtrA
VLAERAGLRIHEVPVDWIDDLDSRVAIAKTVSDDLRGILRLSRTASGLPLEPIRAAFGRPRIADPRTALAARIVRFAFIGVISTLAYVLLYLLLRQAMPAQLANLLALLVTAVGNTALNRRITFGVRGVENRTRHHLRGLLTFFIGWSLTASSLWLLHTAVAVPAQSVEIIVLTAANLAATVVRFSLFQAWVFDDEAPTLPTFDGAPTFEPPAAVLDNSRSN